LILLGIFSFWNMYRSSLMNKQRSKINSKQMTNLQQILSSPEKADIDYSGVISPIESIVLGTALSLDDFGAVLHTPMFNYSPALTSISVATMSGFFIFGGIKLGRFLFDQTYFKKLTYTPPLLLMSIGLFNLFY